VRVVSRLPRVALRDRVQAGKDGRMIACERNFHVSSNAADQIHLVEHAEVSCYIIQDGANILLFDAGLPTMWKLVVAALRELGRVPEACKYGRPGSADLTVFALRAGP
jgi:hypothetical protein